MSNSQMPVFICGRVSLKHGTKATPILRVSFMPQNMSPCYQEASLAEPPNVKIPDKAEYGWPWWPKLQNA